MNTVAATSVVASPEEHHQEARDRQRDDHRAPEREQRDVARRVGTHEVGAEIGGVRRTPFGARRGPAARVIDRRMRGQDRQRRQELRQRRVVVVQSEGSLLPVADPCRQMGELVDGHGRPARRVEREERVRRR
jgi:hypothetical protein